jgi:hypothetical protein
MKHTIMEYLSKQSKSSLIVLGLLFVLFIGVLDYLTRTEIALGVFYLVPISLVTWYVSRWAGIWISTVGAIIWFIANLKMPYSHSFIHYWNGLMRLGWFGIFVFILSAFKNVLEREKKEARIDDLTGIGNRRFFNKLTGMEVIRASSVLYRKYIDKVSQS